MIYVIVSLLTSVSNVHADPFDARLLVASVKEHQTLVSLSSPKLMIFGQCDLPKYFDPAKTNEAPLEAFLNCKQLGEPLPNKPDVRLKLETAFKARFGQTYDDATGASASTIARQSLYLGAISGTFVAGLTKLLFSNVRAVPLGFLFGGVTTLGTLWSGYVGARSAYAERGAAEVLDQINRSNPLTTFAPPLVVEDAKELGLVSRRIFALARAALAESIAAVAFELNGIVPGGGTTGGAGASGSWN